MTSRTTQRKKISRFEVSVHKTPLGSIFAVTAKNKLCAVSFLQTWPTTLAKICKRFGTDNYIEAELYREEFEAYFSKDFTAFKKIRLSTDGTDFQEKVWRQLLKIPAGETKTYGDISNALGTKGGARAVGQAANKNPIGIVIPCHRCVGQSGLLTGYAAGVDRKHWLLEHEGVLLL